jgi:YHS domain-containing protein
VIRILLIAILILLIARAFWRLVDGIIEASGGTPKTRAREQARAAALKLVRDPVCGTHVSPASALTLAAGNTTHYFCSETCRDRFRKSA